MLDKPKSLEKTTFIGWSWPTTPAPIEKRELKCAWVGGSSNVPLGFVSLTENLMMTAMSVWMAFAAVGVPIGVHPM